jgi:RecJ-like exonuclease
MHNDIRNAEDKFLDPPEEKLVKCPFCEGSGKFAVNVECAACEGLGEHTPERLANFDESGAKMNCDLCE